MEASEPHRRTDPRAEARSTAPRDRVARAIRGERPDRTPRDFSAVPEVWEALGRRLGAASREEVRRRLGVDCRVVSHDAFCRHPDFPDIESSPGGWRRRELDGSYGDIWGARRKKVPNPYGALDEFASYPLAGAESLADLRRHPWPRPDWFRWDGLRAAIGALHGPEVYGVRYRVGSVFETAWSLFGLERFLVDLAARPELPAYAMERIADVHVENLAAALREAGDIIDLVYFYDDLASQNGLLLSPRMYEDLVRPHHERIIDLARRHRKPAMLHSCGSVRPLIPRLIEIGLAVLNPIQPSARGMDPESLARDFGGRIAFHGGIDIQGFLPRATPGDVREKVARTVETLGPGYILAGSHHFQGDIPLENILSMYGVPDGDKC
jgi:uroporphyrinogen decarboxylase